MDNPFVIETAGQADWDSALTANFQAIDRGYHITERAGVAVSTGQFLTLSSGGFFHPFNPAVDSLAHAYAFTAAASGDSLTALGWGIVRSLGVNSALIVGEPVYANSGGFAVSSGTLALGVALSGWGVLVDPPKNVSAGGGGGYTPSYFTSSLAIAAVANSLHTFTMSVGGLFGWNRRVRVNGASADLVEVKLYADAGLSQLQYSTLSGGISAVGSFNDRAGWPLDTNSGTVYGTCKVFSHTAGVGSDTISVQAAWEI